MDNTGSKKILIYYVYEILRQYSDMNHKLTQSEIAFLIRDVYGMNCDRKAVGRNINALIEAGIDIETYEENGIGNYLREPLFSDAEVRMLIDSVLASRYISGKYAQDLIEKLTKLATVYFTKRIPFISQANHWVHTDNPQVFLSIETLDEAIETHRKVCFIYNRYGVDKKLHPRKKEPYTVDPYQIISSNGRYYLVGNYDGHDCVTNFRIDLITDVEMLDAKAIPFESLPTKNKSLDIADYVKYSINMYDGQKVSAVLRLKEDRIGDIIDWFGKDITVLPREPEDEEGNIRVRVTGSDNGIRMWAIQYGRIVEVVTPEGLREKIKEDVQKITEKYGERKV